jgi:hypothetical protein
VAAVRTLEAILIVALAVGLPIYWGVRYGRDVRASPLMDEPDEPYAERPTVAVESPVQYVEVPIESVPTHTTRIRPPTIYVAR